jgi:hypothetical protein
VNPTSTSNFAGILRPSFTRPSKKLAVEKRKIEARKKGQLRALERL